MLAAFVILLCLNIAQVVDWNALMTEAGKLQDQGAYAEAEGEFQRALAEAELFGPKDRRLALTLNNLATLYRRQGKFTAENYYHRALAIWTEPMAR